MTVLEVLKALPGANFKENTRIKKAPIFSGLFNILL
jgi:hypothetical protein